MNITTIDHDVTKDEAAKLLEIKAYDDALPQPWLDEVVETLSVDQKRDKQEMYFQLVTSLVWSYDHTKIFGAPHPLTVSAFGLLKAYDRIKGSHFVDETHEQLNVLSIEK